MTAHEPVLVDEVLAMLRPEPGQTIVDCTFGAGGHAHRIADRLGSDGLYIAIDQDPDVRPFFDAFSPTVECQTRFIRTNFAVALDDLVQSGIHVDGILMDLGISSMQIDRPERGFSYARQAPLDMRMHPTDRRHATRRANGGAWRTDVFQRRHSDPGFAGLRDR